VFRRGSLIEHPAVLRTGNDCCPWSYCPRFPGLHDPTKQGLLRWLQEPSQRTLWFVTGCRLILFCNTIIFCTVLVKQRDYFSPKSFSGGLPGARQTQPGEKHYRTLGKATVAVPPSCCVLHPKDCIPTAVSPCTSYPTPVRTCLTDFMLTCSVHWIVNGGTEEAEPRRFVSYGAYATNRLISPTRWRSYLTKEGR
jgi:hypothetical protein